MLCHLLALSSALLLSGSALAQTDNYHTLTALDSAGWIKNYPNGHYVVLRDAPFAVHKVQRLGTGYRYVKNGKEVVPLTVEIYNLLVPAATARRLVPALARKTDWPLVAGDTLLITFSVLPAKDGTPIWYPVQPDTLPAGRRISLAELVGDGSQRLALRQVATQRRDHFLFTRGNLAPIVWRQGRYWAPGSFVLTQYFLVRARRALKTGLHPVDFATLNVRSSLEPYTISSQSSDGIERERTRGGISRFWSRPDVWITDIGELEFYGLHRFDYKPGIGILSGEYRDFFVENFVKNMEYYFDITFTRALIDDKIPIKE